MIAARETLQRPQSKVQRGLGVLGWAGGLWLPRATARMFHAMGTHPELRKQQENYKPSAFSISRTFCLMLFPTGVSGNNINRAWHKGKCLPSSVSLSLPRLVATNSLIFLKFSKEFFFLTSFLHTSKQLNLTRVSYEENQINSSNGCEDENASPERSTGLWEGAQQKAVHRCQI